MGNWLSNIAKTLGPRLIAAVAALLSTKAAEKGITVDPATLIGIGLSVYAGVHKAVSSQVNPGDSATGRVADAIAQAASSTGGSTVVVPPKP